MQHQLYQNGQFRTVKAQDSSIELNRVQGRWSPNQHLKFLQAIITYGKDWKKVQEFVDTRTGSQVRSHAQKYFIKIIKIMKDRKKLKGRKIPDITDTQRQLAQYFKVNNQTQNTPKQICEIMKLASMSKIKNEENSHNGHQKQKFKEQDNSLLKNKEVYIKKIAQSIQLQCGQDQSFLSSIMRRNFDYFSKGGQFSGLIDFPAEFKK